MKGTKDNTPCALEAPLSKVAIDCLVSHSPHTSASEAVPLVENILVQLQLVFTMGKHHYR